MTGATPGQAELRDLIRKRWNEVLSPPEDADTDETDYVQASLAAEVALGAIAAAPARPLSDAAAMAAYGAHYSLTDKDVAAEWPVTDEDVRAHFREVAESVIAAHGMAAQGPQPARDGGQS